MVSIITVNYNGANDTCEMIESFRKHETYTDYEIIVVDNGSSNPVSVDDITGISPDVESLLKAEDRYFLRRQ